ncbi:MAG: hypothetical protein ACREUG_17630, partial [Steroidobacteraceae bacterium]
MLVRQCLIGAAVIAAVYLANLLGGFVGTPRALRTPATHPAVLRTQAPAVVAAPRQGHTPGAHSTLIPAVATTGPSVHAAAAPTAAHTAHGAPVARAAQDPPQTPGTQPPRTQPPAQSASGEAAQAPPGKTAQEPFGFASVVQLAR